MCLGKHKIKKHIINVREYRRTITMDNPEKPVTQGTQDEGKQTKNTTQYMLDTTILSYLFAFFFNP